MYTTELKALQRPHNLANLSGKNQTVQFIISRPTKFHGTWSNCGIWGPRLS